MRLPIQNTFIDALTADIETSNEPRKVFDAVYSFVMPTVPKAPRVLHVNNDLANKIGIPIEAVESEAFLNVFSGKTIYPNTKPFAMCYGGHQFGVWAGQLGDGRAINLFELETNQEKVTLQLKGAGKTPYSRSADGLAVLRSSVREYLCAEAMHHLGVPTTRSLSLITSGNEVLRDVMYNGNPAYEKGAIVCRVASSFIRFGNFEIFASRNDIKNLRALADFTIKAYFPEIKSAGKKKYLDFFEQVMHSSRKMIVEWQRVGFVHGVMNTDNMSIHGITIDYGPYGWLEDYNPNWTPNTTDASQHRYAFGNQPQMALWNLYQLANALYPLINETEDLEVLLQSYETLYEQDFIAMMRKKMGLLTAIESDQELIYQLLHQLQNIETDYTIFFRLLAQVQVTDAPTEAIAKINEAFYDTTLLKNKVLNNWETWFTNYLNRLQFETSTQEQRMQTMNQSNPKYVLRNYMAQLAIEKADAGDYSLIEQFFVVLQNPYEEQLEQQQWFAKRPDWARTKIGCSQLSCSS